MAKTRAQRKAERRAREEQEQRRSNADPLKREARAQHDTQVPVSGDIAEIEAMEAGMAAGAPEAQLETPDAPKPSRSTRRTEEKQRKDAEKRRRAEQKRQESEQLARKQKQASAERQRGGVIGFLTSCWAELKKVQWPDRETLVQATAVTVIFVAVAALYLGALDALFEFLVKRIL
ncbi:MAG TPA: preprotein translocase subunit SecE [Solirubrobacterales bacterium]|jgi:preprotein translocase SecE subunit|nr:preprotein translocase subunit SecE [Solirubrobacterales bacterium]